MRPILFLLDSAPYGQEKAYGVLNAAAVSIGIGPVAIGLFDDGVYLALSGQEVEVGPNLASMLYAYSEIRVVAHEPSLIDRGLFDKEMIEVVELVDHDRFLDEICAAGMVITL